MVPAYTLPPNAQNVKIMRALVKETLSHALAATLADDIAEACDTLKQKGGLHPSRSAVASSRAPATDRSSFSSSQPSSSGSCSSG